MIPPSVRHAIERVDAPYTYAYGDSGDAHTDALILAEYIRSLPASDPTIRSGEHLVASQHLLEAERLLTTGDWQVAVQRATAHALVALAKQAITDNIYVRAEVTGR